MTADLHAITPEPVEKRAFLPNLLRRNEPQIIESSEQAEMGYLSDHSSFEQFHST